MSVAGPPHVLLITCHDLGRHLGCYGVDSVQTPNLDALAAAGVRFTRAFCTSPGCSPSRATLATGRYPHSNGVMGLAHEPFGWGLAPGERHVAALLRERGYETHLFGLQHVTVGPSEQLGFDQVYGRGTGRDVAGQVAAFLDGIAPWSPATSSRAAEVSDRYGGTRTPRAVSGATPPWSNGRCGSSRFTST